MKKLLLILFLFIMACSMEYEDSHNITDKYLFANKPTNLKYINTKYDDYNAYPFWGKDEASFVNPYDTSSETISKRFSLVFSSSRNGSFDFIKYFMFFSDDLSRYTPFWDVMQDSSFTGLPNTKYNEFGPYFYEDKNILYYASDSLNTLDLFSIEYTIFDRSSQFDIFDKDSIAFNPSSIKKLNISTDSTDEAYLTISDILEDDKYYFCSNRNDSVYNIYSTNSLDSTQAKINNILSSKNDDKCPFVLDSIMVFTSNREGGFGGYDLYYSKYKDGKWGNPINFGSNINSEYDEFRPIIIKTSEEQFFDNLMIFSSNRIGGLGGFDLYYIGINKQL